MLLSQPGRISAHKLTELATRQQELAKLQRAATKPGERANAEQLADINGKNLADQAALQPNKIDPEATAQLLAKALEQTEHAERRAGEAAELARQDKGNVGNLPERGTQKAAPDLAALQKHIATQAERMSLTGAAKDAARAADELKRGEIAKAVDTQASALAKLNDPENKPMEAAAPARASTAHDANVLRGLAKSSEAKAGTAPAAEVKANALEPAANKTGPKPGAVKTSEAKTAAVKGGQRSAEAKSIQAAVSEVKGDPPNGRNLRPDTPGEMKTSAPEIR